MAPAVFSRTGLDVIPTNVLPDGRNINDHCGSTNLGELKSRVESENADLGIAFDGDGDRVIFVDNGGYELDGDYAMVLISDLLLKTDPNFNKTVVGTVMSNLGLELALKKRGIHLVRTGVGDRLVYREMKKRDAGLGGEQSGHIIVRKYQSTGDGILTALLFLESVKTLGLDIRDLRSLIVSQPQVMTNITVKRKPDLKSWDELNQLIEDFYGQFGDHSRLVIRYSGTEPKIRIMMESRDEQVITDNINKFVDLIRSRIGE
jgi:phosphoglucosamine mutase